MKNNKIDHFSKETTPNGCNFQSSWNKNEDWESKENIDLPLRISARGSNAAGRLLSEIMWSKLVVVKMGICCRNCWKEWNIIILKDEKKGMIDRMMLTLTYDKWHNWIAMHNTLVAIYWPNQRIHLQSYRVVLLSMMVLLLASSLVVVVVEMVNYLPLFTNRSVFFLLIVFF